LQLRYESVTRVIPEVEAMFAPARIVTLVLAILIALPIGTGSAPAPAVAKSLSGVAVKPKPVCMRPRRTPDTAVPPPTVVSTFPTEGQVVRPGLVVLRFTFNVAMSCDGQFLPSGNLAMPCEKGDVQWTTLTYDRTTIRMPCVVRPNTKYGISMNSDQGWQISKFSSLAGQQLKPFWLTFSTSSGPDADIKAAEAQDKDWPPPAK
jgi:hypothetical protein